MHSPGPWTWDDGKADDMGWIRDADGQTVCDFGNQRSYYPTEGAPPEREDRALILAAPDLLTALKALPLEHFNKDMSAIDAAEFVDHAGAFMRAMELARAAIAKAEGK